MTRIDSEAGRNAFSLLGTLSEQGVLNRQSVSMTLADVMHQFSKGKTAMMFNTCMTVGYIRKNAPDIEFGIAPIPSDGKRITTVGGEIMAVSEDGHVEEALEFMRYLAEPGGCSPIWMISASLPQGMTSWKSSFPTTKSAELL